MSDDNPPPLPPRSLMRQHIPGHTDHAAGLQQQDLQLWQHNILSQPQPAAGVQAVPVGIGFPNRPQQQLWQDHNQPAYSQQRGWQPLPQPHAQQSPQESQEINPQVVRSQQQNWPGGEMNQLQLQQLQQLIWLQQHQQVQQPQMQHPTDQPLHHVDPVTHDEQPHDKFTKSPSPQIEESRHSPSLNRQYMQNVTSPQQQLWQHHQHPQVVHQFEMHGETQQPQAFQHTPAVSHHQPLFQQQQYVQPVWQHTPYSQVQLQHLRQNTPQLQQHLLWQQQQQQQLHQHQLQQHQQQQHNSDPPPPYSPPATNNFMDKPTITDKREIIEMKNDNSHFLNNRISVDPVPGRNEKVRPVEPPTINVGNIGMTPSAPPLSIPNQSANNNISQIRILSKSNQNNQPNDNIGSLTQKPADAPFPNVPSSTPNFNSQKLGQGGIFNANSQQRPQNFNPHPSSSPYQNLNPQNTANKGLHGIYGNQNRYPTPNREPAFNQTPNTNQFRPRSPGTRNQQPNTMANNLFQRNAPLPPQASSFNRMERIDVYIFVQGLNPRTSSETIQSYFEIVGRPAEVKDAILFGIDRTEALVTFIQKPDLFKLKQNVRSRKLDGFTLDICEVPSPHAIVVSSDVQLRSTDTLMYYFERESIGGGPLKKNGVDETEDGCCVLEFENPRVVQRLCASNKQHRVDGILLRVSPYFQCESGTIWDTNLHLVPIPKPVNIQILPDQLEFVKKYCQPQFAARLRDKYADISFSKDHVTVKCSLRQSMPNYRMLVRGWETAIQEAVAKFLGGHIDQSDIVVPDIIWDKFVEWLNSDKTDHKDIIIKQDRDMKHVKLIGFKGALKSALQQINQKIEVLSRAARRKSELRKVKSVEKLVVLEVQGTYSVICRKFPDMKIHVNGNEVTVEGDPQDIPNAFLEIYNECDKIEPVSFKHSKSREYVQFAKKEATKKYIQRRMDQKLLKGSWNITSTEINIFMSKGGNTEAMNYIILDSVSEESVQVDRTSTSLLNSEVWGDFLVDKTRRYKDKAEICTKKLQVVLVVGTDDVVHNIVQQIKDFLDEKTKKTVTVPCDPVTLEFISQCWTENDWNEIKKCEVEIRKKANGLELTGLSEKLIAGKQKFDMKLKRMCSKKHMLRRVGIYGVIEAAKHSGTISAIEKTCKCVIKLPPEFDGQTPLIGSDYEKIDSEPVDADVASTSGPKHFQTKKHKIKIRLVHGEIGTQKADIIVCSSSSNLNLKSGSASYSLVKQGGTQLQMDCNKHYPNGIKDGIVAVIDPGNLNCDKVYLTSLPSWKEAVSNGGKVFRNFMRECLRLADKHSKKSMAFNAMGTGGYLGYPRDVVASIMYGSVIEFDSSYSKTCLKDISIVLYNKDTDSIRAFEEHEHLRIHGSSSVGVLSTDFAKGRLKIELVTDDLALQKVDALLCSVSSDMNLTRSAICKSLVQHGGKSLQDECVKKKQDNELTVGKVVDISGGNLHAKTIYLTLLPTYTESNTAEQSMVSILQTVCQLANLKGYKSVAIPALGTGYLNYPKSTAARCMYDAVLEWADKNPKASLKLIKFVMYSKDIEAQQAYRLCHQRCQGRESRASRNFLGDGSIRAPQDASSKYRMVTDGCVLGPVELKVCSGDILSDNADAIVNGVGVNFDMTGAIAQALVKKCPNILPECQQKKLELKRDGVVTTSGSGLQATYIIHVLFQDSLLGWRNKMLSCLDEANRKLIKSVAFPVIGTGAGAKSFTSDSIAECLFTAMDDFISKHQQPSVTEVRLVIHPTNPDYRAAIMSALQGKTSAAMSQSSVGKWLKDSWSNFANKMGLNPSQGLQPSPAVRQKVVSEMSSIQVLVHSDAIINIDRCIKTLEDKIGLEYTRKTVDVDMTVIKSLSDKQGDILFLARRDECQRRAIAMTPAESAASVDTQINDIVEPSVLVDLKFDRRSGKYMICGPARNVITAVNTIQNKMLQYEREQRNKAEAETLYKQVCWHMEEVTASERKEKSYGLMPNFIIENAYKDGKLYVELEDTAGIIYVIDFNKLEEYPKSNRSDTVKVIRKNTLKVGQAALPSGWMSMSNNENVKKVTLQTNSPEYQKVEKQFITQVKTGPYSNKINNKQNIQVNKIERIQNRTLFQQYSAKKKLMEQQKSSRPTERQLWHGTPDASITSIISNGFNRSYCGVNGVNYGQGVYFAADASYSAQAYLAGVNAKKYMFLVKALTGEFILGNHSMRYLPPVNPSQPMILYDSAVNDINNPMEFVIFNDTQAYPEYLITYSG